MRRSIEARSRPPSRLVLWLLLWTAGPSVLAQICNAPPVAGADQADFRGGPVVVDVLANDSDPDGEALEVLGLSTTCDGSVQGDFGLVTLDLNVSSLRESCTVSYRVQDERGATDTGTVTVRDATGIFADGFEGGDASRWDPAAG